MFFDCKVIEIRTSNHDYQVNNVFRLQSYRDSYI